MRLDRGVFIVYPAQCQMLPMQPSKGETTGVGICEGGDSRGDGDFSFTLFDHNQSILADLLHPFGELLPLAFPNHHILALMFWYISWTGW